MRRQSNKLYGDMGWESLGPEDRQMITAEMMIIVIKNGPNTANKISWCILDFFLSLMLCLSYPCA